MKRTLILVLLLGGGLGAWAQDATTLQVAPSDQVIYPDASQILNKTPAKVEPKAAAAKSAAVPTSSPAVPTTKPLVAAEPVLASADKDSVAAPAKESAPVHGWFLSWTLASDEAGARAWAQGLNRDFQVVAAGEGRWQVLVGPVDAAVLETIKDQSGLAVLVRR